MQIKAFLFDLGNTLVDDSCIRERVTWELAQSLEEQGIIESASRFLSTYDHINRSTRIPFLSHTFGERIFFQDTFRRLGIDRPSAANSAFELYRSMIRPYMVLPEEVVASLKVIKRAGNKTALISNESVERVETVLSSFVTSDLFDAVIVSQAVGIEKPDERIFRAALSMMGVGPGEAIMFGDNEAADGACKRLGIPFVLVKGFRDGTKPQQDRLKYEPDATIECVTAQAVFEAARLVGDSSAPRHNRGGARA